jgi:hypothetical protein
MRIHDDELPAVVSKIFRLKPEATEGSRKER